jgi:hypothetical protein
VRLKATRYISDGVPNGATFEINDHDGAILVGLGHAKVVPEPKPKPQPKAQAYKTREMRAVQPEGTAPPTTPEP